jgi:hypothetical protein
MIFWKNLEIFSNIHLHRDCPYSGKNQKWHFCFFLGFLSLIVTVSKIKSEFIFANAQKNNLLISKVILGFAFLKKNQKWLGGSEIPFWLLRTLVIILDGDVNTGCQYVLLSGAHDVQVHCTSRISNNRKNKKLTMRTKRYIVRQIGSDCRLRRAMVRNCKLYLVPIIKQLWIHYIL